MSKEKVVPPVYPYLRSETPLCCFINPLYKCKYCEGLICFECNGIPWPDRNITMPYTLHIKEECLRLTGVEILQAWNKA